MHYIHSICFNAFDNTTTFSPQQEKRIFGTLRFSGIKEDWETPSLTQQRWNTFVMIQENWSRDLLNALVKHTSHAVRQT
jgi:hypothetical protein